MRACQTAARIIALIILSNAIGHVDSQSHSTTPVVHVHNASALQQERVAWALHRFNDVGLDLPDLEIAFHDGGDPCEGNPGLYRRLDGEVLIDICSPIDHVILHELGHAWAHDALDDEMRDRFMQHWELESWNDYSVPWTDRGFERAADTIAFVLSGIPENPTPQLLRFACAYPVLTEQPTPGIQADVCAE